MADTPIVYTVAGRYILRPPSSTRAEPMTDRIMLEEPYFGGRPPEREQIAVKTYFDFAAMKQLDHATTRQYKEYPKVKEGKILRTHASDDSWWTRQAPHPGMLPVYITPRPSDPRLMETRQAAAAAAAEAKAASGAKPVAGGAADPAGP